MDVILFTQIAKNNGTDQTVNGQPCLCLCCSHATKSGFLALKPILLIVDLNYPVLKLKLNINVPLLISLP